MKNKFVGYSIIIILCFYPMISHSRIKKIEPLSEITIDNIEENISVISENIYKLEYIIESKCKENYEIILLCEIITDNEKITEVKNFSIDGSSLRGNFMNPMSKLYYDISDDGQNIVFGIYGYYEVSEETECPYYGIKPKEISIGTVMYYRTEPIIQYVNITMEKLKNII